MKDEKLFGSINELTEEEKYIEKMEKKLFIMKYGIISVTLIICVILSLGVFTVSHEQAHVQICIYEGGHAEVEFAPLYLGGYTTCSVTTPETMKLHSMNEIYGYHMLTLVMSLWLMVFVIITVLAFNHEDR